jgi:nucleotide-binding universal stress UspA family protein
MHSTKSIKKIVVGVDGSKAAGEALALSIQLARQTGAQIVAVFAVPPHSNAEFLGLAPMPGLQLNPEFQAELESAFKEEWCRPLAEAEVRYRTVFGHGRPAFVIDEVAQAEDADLVIVGRRGRGEIAELMLGSVSHELSHRCTKPVLLVSSSKAPRKERAPVNARAAARG